MDVADIEGRHDVRLVIDGLDPVPLGVLQLDRTHPDVSAVTVPPTTGTLKASWTEVDAGSGVDPLHVPAVEFNDDPTGGQAGAWRALSTLPFWDPPRAGSGVRHTFADGGSLGEGRFRMRVRTRDAIGNAGIRTLGTAHLDRTPPRITGARALPNAEDPRRPVVRVYAHIEDPGDGSGIVRTTVAPLGSPLGTDWTHGAPPPAPGEPFMVAVPGPGSYALEVYAWDAAGNHAGTPAMHVRVLTDEEWQEAQRPPAPETPIVGTGPPGGEPGARSGRPPNAGVRFAWNAAGRFHRRRAGMTLRGTPRMVRTLDSWRALLGRANAAQYAGYTTRGGQVLLGPAAAAALTSLQTARTRRPNARPPSPADLDRMVMGLAVLLHESLHATGPAMPHDYHLISAERALEEGLTEAATVDLLPGYVASLQLPRPLAVRLRAAVARYRPAYRAQVRWVRIMSARATGGPVTARAAVAWRVRAADRWGPERWDHLAAVTGFTAREVKGLVPSVTRAR